MFQKGHECKATHRLSEPVFLKFGPCRSRKRFRPKYCGICPIPGMDCKPTLSTTVNVDFICEGKYTKPTETKSNIYELTGTWKFISVPGRFNLLQSVQITASCQKKAHYSFDVSPSQFWSHQSLPYLFANVQYCPRSALMDKKAHGIMEP